MPTIHRSFLCRARMSWLAALIVTAALIVPSGCSRSKPGPQLACTLLELRMDTASMYYDAVIRVESLTLQDPLKDRFQVRTPSTSFELASLKFTVDGRDPARLEAGDTFVVPLIRPDWKLAIAEGTTELWGDRFWDRLPAKDQWHPSKTEAMTVAAAIEIVNDRGALKPVPSSLPPEWRLAEETAPTADNAIGSEVYRKVRGGRIVEQVEIQYAQLSEEDKARLEAGPSADFLAGWSDCARSGGVSATIAGHPSIVCDLEGVGDFGWTYRFFYVTSGLVVAADVQSDPAELGKTEAEKERERRTDQVFLRYGYGPVGREEWQVMIELRMNRTGAFHKRSRAGETVDKDFQVSDGEFAAVEKALADNGFWTLESRSALGVGFESFLAVQAAERARTVTMRNVREPLFDKTAEAIRRIVLPKVDEIGMQPPAR